MLPPMPPKRVFSSEPFYTRRLSNQTNDTSRVQSSDSRDSESNGEWINPIHTEWTRIPRPHTRNVTHITHGSSGVSNPVANGDSAMVAVIQSDSMTSSSDEKTTSSERPTSSTAEPKKIQVLPYDKREKRKDSRTSVATTVTATPATSSAESVSDEITVKKREVSPAILRDTVNTGSAYR